MILILTDAFDTHADKVIHYLVQKNIKYFRFNLDVESLKTAEISMLDSCWIIEQNNKSVSTNTIETVWARRPFVELTLEEMKNQSTSFKIWKNEWNKTLNGLYLELKQCIWLNPLDKAFKGENKYLQRQLADTIKLNMPPFICSNSKKNLKEFLHKHQKVVLKLMSQEFYPAEDEGYLGLFVNIVTEEDLDEFNIGGENPIILQKYIEKEFEVRYTVVGEKHFVCRIDSQKSKKASIDWRRYDIPNTPHYEIFPPSDIKNKVNELMDILGLNYGAIDFIVTPQEEWFFLEINCLGQWLWIEDLTGMRISEEIANWLISTSYHKEVNLV